MVSRRLCSPSSFAITFLTIFVFILVVLIMDTFRECNDEELIATKSLLQKHSYQLQELKNKNSQLTNMLEKADIKLREKSGLTFVADLPIIYLITPTHGRLEQKADLTRMSYALRLVKNIHWIVIEDSEEKTELVANFLKDCGVQYTHLNALTPPSIKLASDDPNWLKPRGVLQRNAGLEWLRNTPDIPPKQEGVVYFADDDNTYSLKLFDEMRYTKKATVWPVGLVGKLRYESPILKDGKVVDWLTYWKKSRLFALDMAGFAVNLQILLDHPMAIFSNDVQRGYQETTLLSGLKLTLDDLEPKANLCTEVLVWHTRTEISGTKNEIKMMRKYGYASDLNVEV